MKFRPKKFLSLVTASLLAAGGLVGVAAAPAQAASPTTVFDFEANTVGAGGWSNQFGFAAGNNGWANTVDAATGMPANSPAAGTKAIKATEGSGAYSGTNVGGVAPTDSLLGVGTMAASMVFYSPTAGATVRLKVEDSTYSTSVSDDQVTVAGWQTLVFDFSSPTVGSFNAGVNYSLASVNFDPTSTTLQTDAYYIDQVRFNIPQFDFEANTVGAGGWSNQFGFAAGNNGWANTVDAATGMPANSPGAGTKAIKATEGSGAYSGTNIGASVNSASLIGTGSLTATVVFYSPTAGLNLRLKVEDSGYSTSVADDQVTVAGWQTLVFDFASPTVGSFNANVNYSLASVSFDPTSTTLQTDAYYIDSVVFASGVVQQQAPAQTVNYDVKLVASQKNTSTDAYQWTDCGGQSWCVNNNYYMKMIAAGASTTLTYVVTQHGTATAVSGASVNLRINTAYSGSNATWSSGGTSFGAVSSSSGSDAGTISGTTNSSGEVSFTFTNTNTSGEAARTLNNANPYPAGCSSPAGQTKGAIEPTVTAVTGATIGTQYVDVLWPHISSSTINSSIAAGSDGQNCAPTVTPRPGTKVWSPYFDQDKKGFYPHVRLEKSFLNEKLDGTWWDGVWQNRDADTRAYLKYIPVGSTFALTYHVTDEYGHPYVGAKVSLIVNANYSCAKTFFAYEGSLIGPDDCAGGGETELPAKTVGADGRVTFVLTNTNTTGEAMPADLNGPPNPATKEVGTNIKPNVVGAKQQGIDMLFAHFVDQAGMSKATGPGAKTATIGTGQVSEFTLTDDAGKPMSNTDVKYFVNGFDSKAGFARTDAAGKVRINSTNSAGLEGMQTVGVSLVRDGKLPLAATATINWMAPELALAAAGAAKSVVVKVAGAAGQTVQIKVAGKTYRRVAQSAITEFSIPSTAGKKSVSVKVGGKTLSRTVTVTK